MTKMKIIETSNLNNINKKTMQIMMKNRCFMRLISKSD